MSKKIDAYLIDERTGFFSGLRSSKFSKLYIPVVPGLRDRGILAGSFKRGTLDLSWDISYREVLGSEDYKLQKRVEKGDFYNKLEIEEGLVKKIIENARNMENFRAKLYSNLNSIKSESSK